MGGGMSAMKTIRSTLFCGAAFSDMTVEKRNLTSETRFRLEV